MGKCLDLSMQRFDRLVAIKFAGVNDSGALWLCRCDCGNEKVVSAKILRSGHARSCGCLNKECSAKRVVLMNRTHGHTGTRIYGIWSGIKKRCYNQNANNYVDYGGRGISICDEWQAFEPFYKWAMSNGYSDELSIDRIDNNGNYCPENCRWATDETQARNRRSTRKYGYKGKSLTLAEWGKITGINPQTLSSRIHSCKWDIEKTLTTPQRA